MSQMQFSAVKFKIAPLQSAFIITLSACTAVLLFSSLFWGGSADPDRLLETIFFPYNLSIFLLVLSPQTFRIKPPMCITKRDVDFAVEVFHTALQKHVERAAAK